MAYNYNQGHAQFQVNPYEQQGIVPSRTLWMGELDPWMDENYLRQLYWSMGEEVGCRLSIDKYGGTYAFIDFQSHEGAAKILQSVNGSLIPNTNKYFKLNWSTRDGNGNPIPNSMAAVNFTSGFCIFVGDLGPDVDDNLLMQAFQRYPSIRSAKVMIDPSTGYSRGFGFIKFLEELDQQRAIEEMQGVYVGSRPVRVSIARPRAKFDVGLNSNVPEAEITTVFVGCLNNTITEEELRAFFGTYGEILAVKIIPNKNIAFIQYEKRSSAEASIAELNGAHLGGAKLRLSFGRTQLNTGPGYHYSPPVTNNYNNTSVQQNAYQTPPVIPPPAVSIPPVVSIDLVDPKKSVPVRIQNERFLSSQEFNSFSWVSTTSTSEAIKHLA